MGCGSPKFYGLPKIQKPDTPLRHIVSSCGLVTYSVAKEPVKYSNIWLVSFLTTLTLPKTLLNRSKMLHCHLGNAPSIMMLQPCSPQSQETQP